MSGCLSEAIVDYYSPYQFALYRVIFGIFSAIYLLLQKPYSLIINLLLILLSLLLILGIWRRVVSVFLFIAMLKMPYAAFILFAFSFIPPHEPLVLLPRKAAKTLWHMPSWIYYSAWFCLLLIYGIGASRIFNGPSSWYEFIYAALLVLFIFLSLFGLTRKWAWTVMLGIQLIILFIYPDILFMLGIIMLHLFVFDARWLKPKTYVEHPIVFFDGYCGLCDWFVNLALSEDKAGILRFSPLQGQIAQQTIGKIELEKLESVILFDNNKLYRQSEAILRILSYLGGLWRLFEVAYIIPVRLRNYIYYIIARHRYQWFGKRASCRFPSQKEKKYFLP